MPWSRRFADSISGIATLKEAADYILKLSKMEQAKPHWQAAAEAVMMAAEGTGPIMHARIGMLRAMNSGKPKPERVRSKAVKSYRIIK